MCMYRVEGRVLRVEGAACAKSLSQEGVNCPIQETKCNEWGVGDVTKEAVTGQMKLGLLGYAEGLEFILNTMRSGYSFTW